MRLKALLASLLLVSPAINAQSLAAFKDVTATSNIVTVCLPDSTGLVFDSGIAFSDTNLDIDIWSDRDASITHYDGNVDIEDNSTLGTWDDPGTGDIAWGERGSTGCYEIDLANELFDTTSSTHLIMVISGVSGGMDMAYRIWQDDESTTAGAIADIAGVDSKVTTVDTVVDGIDTDLGTPVTTIAGDITAVAATLSTVNTNVNDIESNVGTPTGASIAADIAALDTVVDTHDAAIKADITDAEANIPDNFMAEVVEPNGSYTVKQTLRINLSHDAGCGVFDPTGGTNSDGTQTYEDPNCSGTDIITYDFGENAGDRETVTVAP